MNRRNFIDKTGRGMLFGGLAALTGLLVSRQQVSRYDECIADFQCKKCNRLSKCGLPEAEIERGNG